MNPVHLEDHTGKSGIHLLDNNSDGFVDSEGLAKKVLISYYSVPDIDLSSNENTGLLKENPDNALKDWAQVVVIEDLKVDNGKDNSGMQTENLSEGCTQLANENGKDESCNDNNCLVKDNRENIEVNGIEPKIDGNKKPSEVEKRTKYNQTMRLPQFPREDVEKIMEQFREKFMRHVNCKHCGFTAKDSRALSAHMTRLHK